MPEYRRFIAYFYEYIDGKKRKNAGFAKVELRNGMWRILFRLMTDTVPEGSLQVYGFVREQGYLLGFVLGSMQSRREIGEEWAYQADAMIGHEMYRFADLSGIWFKSADGREFITVWDDEGLDTSKFVLELPQDQNKAADTELLLEEAETEENAELSGEETERKTETGSWAEETGMADQPKHVLQEELKAAETEDMSEIKRLSGEDKVLSRPMVEEIYQKRKKFSPFQDEEITDCVQILPCDVIRMQQGNWNVGRSSFLQHGFYQYRHLLFGKQKDGNYIIGVPGEKNPQEQYMAEMFGYDRFKCSQTCECGKKYGYWYRTLTRQP